MPLHEYGAWHAVCVCLRLRRARVRSCVELATRRTLPALLAWFGLVRFCSWAGARVLQPSLVGYFGLCLFG